jgi:predicted nucleic acid-binding protein
MPATLIDISDPNLEFPDFLVLDASLVLELALSPENHHHYHAAAINFLRRLQPLARQEQVMPLLPLLAFEECYFKICRLEIESYLSNIKNNQFWHTYYKQNPQILERARTTISNFYQILQAFPIVIVEPEDLAVMPIDTEQRLADRMGEMIFDFLVLPKDATILSNAIRLGVDTVVTLDKDWARADGFNVVTIV